MSQDPPNTQKFDTLLSRATSSFALDKACDALLESIDEGNWGAVRIEMSNLPIASKEDSYQPLWIVYRQILQSARADNIHEITLLVRDLLCMDHFPKPQEILNGRTEFPALAECMRNQHTIFLIPLLYEHGWQCVPGSRHYQEDTFSLGKDLARGEWPYPDLICPNLFLSDSACDSFTSQFFLNLFFNNGRIDWGRHTVRLLELPHVERLGEGLEEALAMGPWRSELKEDLGRSTQTLELLVQHRLIDPARVAKQANRKATGTDFIHWLTEIGAQALRAGTHLQQANVNRHRL